jgi:hypothetical protein
VLEMLLGNIMNTIKEVDNFNGMTIGVEKPTM